MRRRKSREIDAVGVINVVVVVIQLLSVLHDVLVDSGGLILRADASVPDAVPSFPKPEVPPAGTQDGTRGQQTFEPRGSLHGVPNSIFVDLCYLRSRSRLTIVKKRGASLMGLRCCFSQC